MSDLDKITEAHRRLHAIVYVRQSSPGQVQNNHESRALQYALRERAIELGWVAEQVAIVDEDLARSGTSTDGRLGFKDLVAEVGLGRVGLILGSEVSRLARNSADWYQLLDLCTLTGTLVADSDGIYSPGNFNDRMLLGLKGTLAEAELHLIRARLDGGLRNKAKRGELELNLPVGLDREEGGRIALSADEQVRHAIGGVFELWRRLGSARQVVITLREEGQLLPRRTVGQQRVRWAQRATGRCTTSSPTRRMRARSCSGAPRSASSSTGTGACASARSSCRSGSGPSACTITIPATCPGMSTSTRASGSSRT
jgi:DNA invertase Pin-like site-specific DNA recombinase